MDSHEFIDYDSWRNKVNKLTYLTNYKKAQKVLTKINKYDIIAIVSLKKLIVL